MMNKYGFIGCGKMASAIIKGILRTGYASSDNILASKSSAENLEKFSKDLGIKIILDNTEVAKFADILFIAVKPNQVCGVLQEIKTYLSQNTIVVSIAAGINTKQIEKILPKVKVVRVMPNTPVLVNEGMAGIAKGSYVDDSDIEKVQNIFNEIGKSVVVEESQIDIVTAISGSGPAFFYKVINDIARAGEKLGLDYKKSLLLSIQTAIGSGKMALRNNMSMEELISNVATKGGCTREGVDIMEQMNTEKIFFEVVKSTAEKAKNLG